MHRSFTLFGAIALIGGFRKHRRATILFLMLGGLGCIAGTAWFGDKLPSHALEVAIVYGKWTYDHRPQAESHILQILRMRI